MTRVDGFRSFELDTTKLKTLDKNNDQKIEVTELDADGNGTLSNTELDTAGVKEGDRTAVRESFKEATFDPAAQKTVFTFQNNRQADGTIKTIASIRRLEKPPEKPRLASDIGDTVLKPMPYAISNPAPVANQAFRGSNQAANVYNVTIGTQVIPVIVPQNPGPGVHLPPIEDVAKSLAMLPAPLRAQVTQVMLNPVANPDDAFWNAKRGNTASSDMTTGADGKVTIYPSKESSPAHRSPEGMNRSMMHEIGHAYGRSQWGADNDPRWQPWLAAMEKDVSSVSGYADSDQGEDLCETLSAYHTTLGTSEHDKLRAKFPNRFAMLDKIFGSNILMAQAYHHDAKDLTQKIAGMSQADFQALPAENLKQVVHQLMAGYTSGTSENAISNVLDKASDQQFKDIVSDPAIRSQFLDELDDQPLAKILLRLNKIGETNLLKQTFAEIDKNHNGSSDDVAAAFVGKLKADQLKALPNDFLKQLYKAMNDGYTTSSEETQMGRISDALNSKMPLPERKQFIQQLMTGGSSSVKRDRVMDALRSASDQDFKAMMADRGLREKCMDKLELPQLVELMNRLKNLGDTQTLQDFFGQVYKDHNSWSDDLAESFVQQFTADQLKALPKPFLNTLHKALDEGYTTTGEHNQMIKISRALE